MNILAQKRAKINVVLIELMQKTVEGYRKGQLNILNEANQAREAIEQIESEIEENFMKTGEVI